MFTIQKLAQPQSVDEAYQLLTAHRNNAILGGCAFLRLGAQRIGTAIDLSHCQLSYINETADEIIIGASATLRDLETSPVLQTVGNGIVSAAVSNIIGVQLRNVATVGASVFSKYGFSDLIPSLLALDTDVQLYMGGRLPLAAFLRNRNQKDILTQVIIKKNARQAAYHQFRKSHSDFPLLNAAVSKLDNSWRIVIGARPGRARFARRAAEFLSAGELNEDRIITTSQIVADELPFETNTRASASYRRILCQALVQRGIREVLSCK